MHKKNNYLILYKTKPNETYFSSSHFYIKINCTVSIIPQISIDSSLETNSCRNCKLLVCAFVSTRSIASAAKVYLNLRIGCKTENVKAMRCKIKNRFYIFL